MSDRERVKRPKLERRDPIRSWSTLFGLSGPSGDDAGNGAASGSGALQDVLARSVDLGYRVIDEYIRRGQQAAQRLNNQSYSSTAAAGEVQDLSLRMAQYASDFTAVWFDMLQAVAGAAARPPTNPSYSMRPSPTAATAAAPATTPASSEADDHARVRIEVVAARPTEVSLDLRPQAATRSLIVHALRAVDPEMPRLTDVTLRAGSAEEPAVLRLCVPGDQPPGVYNALIIDEETSRPVGTLSVRIIAT